MDPFKTSGEEAICPPHSPFAISISSLEFKIDVFATLAANFYFEFIGRVFAALPYRFNQGKVRAPLSWQLMVSVLVSGHVNSIGRTASGGDF